MSPKVKRRTLAVASVEQRHIRRISPSPYPSPVKGEGIPRNAEDVT
jgi:hypothetical protein